jgi:signal peptidase I
MRPTLTAGDIVLCVTHLAPQRGDVVVVEFPGAAGKGIKRVVGLPSDTVTYIDKELMVNDQIATKEIRRKLPSDDTADLLVSQRLFDKNFDILETYGGSLTSSHSNDPGYFVMGDNRDDSVDSRQLGRVAPEHMLCRAVAVLATEVSRRIVLDRLRWL